MFPCKYLVWKRAPRPPRSPGSLTRPRNDRFRSRRRLRCLARGRLRRQSLPAREARVRKIVNVRGDVSSEGEWGSR